MNAKMRVPCHTFMYLLPVQRALWLTEIPLEVMLSIAKQLPWSTLAILLQASPEFLHLKERCKTQEDAFRQWINWTIPYPTLTPSLRLADACVKDDAVIVSKMLRKDPLCYRYASERLKNDRHIALQALSMHEHNILHAPKNLVSNEAFMLEVINMVHRSYLCATEPPFFVAL